MVSLHDAAGVCGSEYLCCDLRVCDALGVFGVLCIISFIFYEFQCDFQYI